MCKGHNPSKRLQKQADAPGEERVSLVAGMQAVRQQTLPADRIGGLYAADGVQIEHRQGVKAGDLQQDIAIYAQRRDACLLYTSRCA